MSVETAVLPAGSRDNTTTDPTARAPLVLGPTDYASVTERVCRIVEMPTPPRAWYVAFGIAASLTGILGLMILYLISTGVASGASTSRSRGASTSRTSSSGWGSATRAR